MPKSKNSATLPVKLPQHPKLTTPIDKSKKLQAMKESKLDTNYQRKMEEVKKVFPTKEAVELYKKQHDAHFEMISAYDEKYDKENPLLNQPHQVDDVQEAIHSSIDKHLMQELGYSTNIEGNSEDDGDDVNEDEGKTRKEENVGNDSKHDPKYEITLHDLLPEKLHGVARLPFLLGDAFEALDKKPTTANELDLHNIPFWMLIEDFLSAENSIDNKSESDVADSKKRARFRKAILETFDDQDLERWGYAKAEAIESIWPSRKNDKPPTTLSASVDTLALGVTREDVEEFIQMLSIYLFGYSK